MILLSVVFAVAMVLFHAYHAASDKSTQSGAGEILSASVVCFRSSILSVLTLLMIFIFVDVKPEIQNFIVKLLVWQTIFSLMIVLVLLIFGIVRMKRNSPLDYSEVGSSVVFGIAVCAITLICLAVYHSVYSGKSFSKEKEESKIK